MKNQLTKNNNKKLPVWVLYLALATDIFDILNLLGKTTIFGYAITKPITIGLNVVLLMIIASYKGLNLEDMKLFVFESLPFAEYLPIATYMVIKYR